MIFSMAIFLNHSKTLLRKQVVYILSLPGMPVMEASQYLDLTQLHMV